MQRRYQSLQLRDAISRRNDYVEACRELRCILRAAYVYAPKPFQALLYEDIVHAFRNFPRVEKSQQLGAAKSLLQTAEDLFPEQWRASAAHEYKTAITAWHQQYKNPEPLPERLHLSEDTLLHVFKYLDGRSLAAASAVCREWNVAANDETLWHTQYSYRFGTPNPSPHLMLPENADFVECAPRHFWRKAFNHASKDQPSHLFTSARAHCLVCKGVIWLMEPPWKPAKGTCVARNQSLEHHSPKPMSVNEVVRYVVSRDTASDLESCSSDSDEDDNDDLSSLWNIPAFLDNGIRREDSNYT